MKINEDKSINQQINKWFTNINMDKHCHEHPEGKLKPYVASRLSKSLLVQPMTLEGTISQYLCPLSLPSPLGRPLPWWVGAAL